MALKELNQDFLKCIEDIMYSTVNIQDPYDRVTTMQWIRRLQNLDDKAVPAASLRNEYANFLRITLDNEIVHLCAPFKEPPPEGQLRPLAEVLANGIARKCPPIPMTGPMEPVMFRMSDDGRAYTTIKQSPDGGIYCYMAVTPDDIGK